MASNFAAVLIGNLPPLSKFNKALERVSFGKNPYTGQTLQWAILGTDENSNVLLVSVDLLMDHGWWILNTGQAAASAIDDCFNQDLREILKDEISSDLIIPFGNRLGFSYVGIEGVDDYDRTYYIFDVEKSLWRLHKGSYQKNRISLRSEQPNDNEPIYCGNNAQPDGYFGPAVLDAIEAGTSDTGLTFTFNGFDISERYYFSTFIDPYEPAYIKEISEEPSIERVFIRPAIVVKPEALSLPPLKTSETGSKSPLPKTTTTDTKQGATTVTKQNDVKEDNGEKPFWTVDTVTCLVMFLGLLVMYVLLFVPISVESSHPSAPNLEFSNQYVELKAKNGKLATTTRVSFLTETDPNCTVTYSITDKDSKAGKKIRIAPDKTYSIVEKGLKKGTYAFIVKATSTSNDTQKVTSKTAQIEVIIKQ